MIVRRQEEKKNIYLVSLPEVGFEPTHPKITELKSAALDHSAIQALEHKEENKEKNNNWRGRRESARSRIWTGAASATMRSPNL